MATKDKVLYLSALFDEYLTKGELIEICQRLRNSRVLASDLTSKPSISHALVASLNTSKDKKWPKQITDEIQRMDKKKLAVIVKELLSQNNPHLLWVISNWKDLSKSPNTFVNMEWLLSDSNAKHREKLLDVAHSCVEWESDSIMLQLMVEQMKSNLGKHLPQKTRKVFSSSTSDPKVLHRMKPMLACELTIQMVLNLSKHLLCKKLVSKDVVEKIEKLHNSAKQDCVSKALEIVIECICKLAETNWESLFLQSVADTAGVQISHILDACLKHSQARIIQWLTSIWKELKDNYDVFCHAYYYTYQCTRFTERPEWLLQMTHSLIVESSPEKCQQFARILSQTLQKKASVPTVSQIPGQSLKLGPTMFGDAPSSAYKTPDHSMANTQAESTVSMPGSYSWQPLTNLLNTPLSSAHANPYLLHQLLSSQIMQYISMTGRYPSEMEMKQLMMKMQLQAILAQQKNVFPSQDLPDLREKPPQECRINIETSITDESKAGFDKLSRERVQRSPPPSQVAEIEAASNQLVESRVAHTHQTRIEESPLQRKSTLKDSQNAGTTKEPTTEVKDKQPTTEVQEMKDTEENRKQGVAKEREGKQDSKQHLREPAQHKESKTPGTDSKKEHSYNTRSKGKNDVEVCDTLTCMEPYKCTSHGAMEPPQLKKNETILEIRVIVDKYPENLNNSFRLYVYIDNLKQLFLMHEDRMSISCFHTFVCVEKKLLRLTYKYMMKNGEEQLWEAVPKTAWDHIVNRHRNEMNCVEFPIIFDVCNFGATSLPISDINSMHSRNMGKHLPDVMHLKLANKDKAVMELIMYYNYISNWWMSAKKGICYETYSTYNKTAILSSCNSILRDYIKTTKDLDPVTSVAVHLVLSMIICKFKIEVPRDDNQLWKKLCSKLVINSLSSADCKKLYKEVESIKVDMSDAWNGVANVVDKAKQSPKCLLLLPLVYIMVNDGDCTYNEEKWKKMKSVAKFRQLTDHFHKHQDSFFQAVNLHKKVKSFAQLFPGLPKLYQELDSFESTCQLLKTDADFMNLYDAQQLLERLLSSLHDKTTLVSAKNSGATEWMYEKLQEQLTTLPMEDTFQKLKKTFNSLIRRLCSFTNENKDLEMLAWALSLVFLLPMEQRDLEDLKETLANSWIVKEFDNKFSDATIMFLNFIVDGKIADDETKTYWNAKVQQLLKQFFIEKLTKDVKFVHNFDDTNQTKLHKVVVSSFNEALVECITEQSKNTIWTKVLDLAEPLLKRKEFNKSLSTALENMFLRTWQNTCETGNNKVLQLLQHPAAFSYLKIIGLSDEGYEKSKSQRSVEEFKLGLAAIVQMFKEGSIPTKNLKEILAAEDEIVVGLSLINKGSNVDKTLECSAQLFATRRKELNVVEHFLAAFDYFVTFCLATNESSLLLTHSLDNLDTTPWCEVVECYIEGVQKNEQNDTTIIIYGLTTSQQQAVREIYETGIKENEVLCSYWTELYIDALRDKMEAQEDKAAMVQLSVPDIVENVWTKMLEIFCPLKMLLLQGSISLAEVDKYFANLEKSEIPKLFQAFCRFPTKDFAHSGETEDDKQQDQVADQRVEQIINYFAIKKQKHNISALLAIRDKLKLNGNFAFLDIIQDKEKFSDKNALKSVTEQMISAGNALGEITDEHCDLIWQFLKEAELIEWLKIMKDRSEVKVMSDLAMISAGESVQDVDRVSCFLSAVMGFAPFLFDLVETSELDDVLTALQKVWEHSKRDTKLLTKWTSTASCLQWLKGIKDFHGSVEKSSLLKAQDINTKGIYIVGGGGKVPTVGDCVRLCWPQTTHEKETDETDEKEMSLSDLQDLQSRLMLIEDKALEGVDLFIQTLSLVENLAQAYVDLKEAGCLLFNNFTVEIISQPVANEESELMAKISFDKACPNILFHQNTISELQKLISVMKEALDSWKKNFSLKRSEFYHLNHYNVQQIIYLSQQLASAMDSGQVPDQVYTLLSFIKDDICLHEVLKWLGEVTSETEVVEEDEAMEIENEEEPEVEEETDAEKRRKVVTRLKADDVDLEVAKAAVQQAKELNYDEIFLWCLDHEHDDDLVDEHVKQFDTDIGFVDPTVNVGVVESVVKNKASLTLHQVIEKLVNEENEDHDPSVCIKTICWRYIEENSKTSLSDCISLDSLGQFLSNISMLVEEGAVPERQVPEMLHQNVNLLICQEKDTFTTLISLYMHSPEQPLPTATEVLLCSDETSQSDVDLLLRRAVISDNKKGKRIYCMAHTEKLDFEVANSVQNRLHQLQENHKDQFTLVILCSSNQHYIASLFNEQKVDYVMKHDVADVKQYLKHKLNGRQQQVAEGHSALLVTSHMAGLGKSLYITRNKEKLPENYYKTTVRFLEKSCDQDNVLETILQSHARNADPHFIHFDVTPAVQNGINYFLFNLIILGSFEDSFGVVWKKQNTHTYCIEYTFLQKVVVLDSLLLLLPTVTCLSPLQILKGGYEAGWETVEMDVQEFNSATFQRPYQYLLQITSNLDRFKYKTPQGSPKECLQTLLKYCSVENPSWSEMRHFASFLNYQLHDCEKSVFCDVSLMGPDSGLSGFKNFVVKFMIRMSQDFATPSLVDARTEMHGNQEVFELHQLRRSWEQSKHPYLFFNEDGMSMTFLNFQINNNGDLISLRTNQVIEKGIMSRSLVKGLQLQRVNLRQNFDELSRMNKLDTLYRVFGIKGKVVDPDPTYELTNDNVVKMLAIHMRFRCDIPVIIMGETGCGKTRMVEFLCKLKANNFNSGEKETADGVENMVIVKVHGGVTVKHIQEKVIKASELAEKNKNRISKPAEESKEKCDTILFLDEANTTEAIYAIKEFVCDGSVCGKPIHKSGLNIVAACNPYRKHTDEAIKKMENAGLGFKVKTDDTTDKLGEIPMRCLVYRVIALPPSMHPLVWDFGQLNSVAETVYIEQMVNHETVREHVRTMQDRNLMVHVLSRSQAFMRENRQECLFVSLRDVERCLVSFKWFYSNKEWLFKEMKHDSQLNLVDTVQCMIQAVGMCYHATLNERQNYRQMLSQCFTSHGINLSEKQILEEIIACQKVFLGAILLGGDIASNEALRENVFMIVMCCEMRIPLFLIGKPGSSKSLAKTIVTDAMQGGSSNNEVFQKLKQIHVLSFQCSPVTDAIGIESVFKQCESLQEKQDRSKFVAVVVLDEIGLAEDSPKMPLKVLHPLLESGVTNGAIINSPNYRQDQDSTINRVGFVGISNWALDPAKMNRGLFVHRGAPTEEDLKLTARGIFSSEKTEYGEVSKIVDAVTKSYLEVDEQRRKRNTEEGGEQSIFDREFFGLRDYYGLLKMIYAVYCDENTTPSFFDVFYAVLRNFSGAKFDSLSIFVENFKTIWPDEETPDIPLDQVVKDNLRLEDSDDTHFCESRYLLLMTNHLAAVNLLANITTAHNFEVVFGSSFPQDNNYTEKCRNINRIKMCMEAGSTVLLLNLKDLYESLYDALNQHYVTFAGQRYVDLGLGGHRVKCRVHKSFRLVVMEDMEIVYKEFPIPLINRLEKHIFTTKSLLTTGQKTDVQRLEQWVHGFSDISQPQYLQNEMAFMKTDAFVGYMDDTAGSAVITAKDETKSFESAQALLLNTATCDGVMRLESSKIRKETYKWQEKYFNHQCHDNLFSLLQSYTNRCTEGGIAELDVTSFSQILSEKDRQILEASLDLKWKSIMLLTLQQFKTIAEFAEKLEKFLVKCESTDETSDGIPPFIILIQCPQAHTSINLIACAKHTVKNVLRNKADNLQVQLIVAFLFTLERQSNLPAKNQIKSFVSSGVSSVFVDELRVTADYLGSPSKIRSLTIGELFQAGAAKRQHENHESVQKQKTNYADPSFKIDLHYLLTHSLSLALTKLKPEFAAASQDRFKMLLSAFSSEDIICRAFVVEITQLAVVLAHERDHQLPTPSTWMKTVALSSMALQEGGSYTKTLWLHLKKLASTVLAYIISEIDEDRNLDILWCEKKREVNRHLKQVWFDLFKDKTVCQLSWNNFDRVQQFVVRGSKGFACQFPFSRKIVSVFQKQWELVQHQQDAAQYFHNKIKNMKLSGLLSEAFQHLTEDVLNCFVHDMVHLCYSCGTGEDLEFELIQNVLMEVWKQKQTDFDADVEMSSNFAALLFVIMKTFSVQLKHVSSILRLQPEILTIEHMKIWLKSQEGQNKVTLQTEILKHALEHIQKKSDGLETVEDYHRWADVIRKIRPTAEAILLTPGTESQDKTWKALAFGALFLEQLIPTELDENLKKGYVEVLLPSSKRLWKGALAIGLNNDKYLNMLVKNLNGSFNKIRLMYLLNWQNTSCKQCKKPVVVDPVILPCSHFMCHRCTKFISLDRQCPTCRENLPGDFELKPTAVTEIQAKDLDVLSANCTSFFLEYLSTLCFPAPGSGAYHTDVKKNVTAALHKLVIQDKETKEMAPLQSTVVDSTPTVRSFILQLLLRYEQTDVQEELELHFTTIGNLLENKVELMMIYMQCIEDMLHQKIGVSGQQLLQKLVDQFTENDFESQLQHLDFAANLRYIVHLMIDLAYNELQGNDETNSINEMVLDLIKIKSETVKMYFTKAFCRRYGIDLFPDLLEHNVLRHLVPDDLSSDGEIQRNSLLIVTGETFTHTKAHLDETVDKDDTQEVFDDISGLCTSDTVLPVILGVLDWSISDNDEEGEEKTKAAQSLLSNLHQSQNITDAVYNVSTKVLQQKESWFAGNTLQQDRILELVLNAVVASASSADPLIVEFCDMMADHANIGTKLLPTMPQAGYFDIRHIFETWIDKAHRVPPKQYQCPKGHPYIVGDCGNVILDQKSAKCPECKMPIGGKGYGQLQPGNTVGEIPEASQAGYKLPSPKHRGLQAVPERKCNRLSVCTLRFLLHSHLLLHSEQAGVQKLLSVAGPKEARKLILLHLDKDLQQLANSLGKSCEDSALFLHQIFKHFTKAKHHAHNLNCNFMSIDGREAWEANIQNSYLVPVFNSIDQHINEARSVVLDAKKKSDLERLVYEIPIRGRKTDDNIPAVVPWNHPILWKYHVNITVNHLQQKLTGDVTSDTDDGAVLQMVLERQNLHVLCHLEAILEVQTALVERYRQRVDASEVDRIAIKDYLEENNSIISEEKFLVYLKLWNKYRHQLKVDVGSQLPSEYFDEELTLESPISTCIPSKVERGQCALLFTKFVVQQQNDVISKCREMLKPTPTFEIVEISQLSSNDIISIENEQVLLPYVLANSQYEASTSASGSKHEIKYRIPALQKQILQRFILYKKLINDEGIQCIEFLQDVGMAKEFEKLAENVKQEKLPIKVVQKLEGLKGTTTMPMICEAVRTLTLVVKHLSKMKGDEKIDLTAYIRNDLMLSADEAELIPSSSKLCHTRALFEWFSWQRSLKYVMSGQNPFRNVVKQEDCEDMNDMKTATEFLATVDKEQLQIEINSFLIMKTDLNTNVGLKHYLGPFADEREVEAPWIEGMPEEISVKHAVHLFKTSVQQMPNLF